MHRSLLPLSAVLALASSLALAAIPEVGGAADDRPEALESAPSDSAREALTSNTKARLRDVEAWLDANPTHRYHAQLDRPLYRPGDPIQAKIWGLTTGLEPSDTSITVRLVDPRGTTQQTQGVHLQRGGAAVSFPLSSDAPGGQWKVEIVQPDGTVVERPLTVASFQAPRIKKSLEFAADSYGPGEEVRATVTLERSTGELLADTEVTVRVQAEGQALPPQTLRTDAQGRVDVRFAVPAGLSTPDVLLTVLVDDGGVTESISRAVPVVLDRVALAFFPEGGDLVEGLPSRVYFEATDAAGEPAEVRGSVVDGRGHEVARLATWTDGRGHVTLTPRSGQEYSVRLDGRDASFPLPAAQPAGCVLHHHDDLEGAQRAVRVSVRCTEDQDVIVLATQHGQILDEGVVRVRADHATTVHLQSGDDAIDGAQGIARVTVFTPELAPLAERLVYRNLGRDLTVELSPDKDGYAPGDEVVLAVRTVDPEGHPVPAELALSVVDDALLSFADDSGDDLTTRMLLQADLPEPIDEAAELFADADPGLALDLALGTRGWRRFDWSAVPGFVKRQREQALAVRRELLEDRMRSAAVADDCDVVAVELASTGPRMHIPRRKATQAVPSMAPPPMDMMAEEEAPRRDFAGPRAGTGEASRDKDAGPGSAPITVRTDFRDTVAWQPRVRTDRRGTAEVRFRLSDAVAGFRATAEGVGSAYIGRGEVLLSSRLPFSAYARTPVALSSGDRLLLPVTLDSDRERDLDVSLTVHASDLLSLGDVPSLTLPAGESRTVFVPVEAAPGAGEASLTVVARTGDTGDALEASFPVQPVGFPIAWGTSGTLEGRVSHTVDVPVALPGSVHGRVTVFPTPVSELTEGLAGMVRMPGGCFEQTSSTNYPNVLVLDYLEETDASAPVPVDTQAALRTGYDNLAGYQVGSGGFETWGSGPGKEALSAFGLLQFADMARVYDVDPSIIDENVAYLYSQRDGHGGFQTTGASAHGYGTAPPEVLNAYITYAMVETGHTDLRAELDAQEAMASRTDDPYRLALATLSLLEARPAAGQAAAERLARLQIDDGSFPGSETSITRSESQNLDVEATALAAMAMVRAGDLHRAQRAVEWIQARQHSPGVWGASQANALALKAITTVARHAGRMDSDGTVKVWVDGDVVARAHFAVGHAEPIDLDISPWLTPGHHDVQIGLSDGVLPYAMEVAWAAEVPLSAEDRRVDLSTSLATPRMGLGETNRLTAELTNRTGEVVPDPIARIGLPAGLQAQTWQLDELRERGVIAFYETRPREVTLYWDGLGADEVHRVELDLVAEVPGTFTAPASSAYPYYDDEAKAWIAGTKVDIHP